MRFYSAPDGTQKRFYKINPPKGYSAPFVGVATDGRQVIADFYAGPRFASLGEPLGPDLVVHWFGSEGDFLGQERRPIIVGIPTPPPYSHRDGDVRWQMLAWMAELGVTESPVEVKKFASESGMYIQDPMLDVGEYDSEYDFDYARENGILNCIGRVNSISFEATASAADRSQFGLNKLPDTLRKVIGFVPNKIRVVAR